LIFRGAARFRNWNDFLFVPVEPPAARRQFVPEDDMKIKLIAAAGLAEAETGMKTVKVC
jgi:hypothetical protein